MRRLLPWVGAFLVALLAGGGAVVALNATVFGPGDFVRVYLDALARGDAESALTLPGVEAGDAASDLLVDDVLIGVSEVRQLSDEPLGAGPSGQDRHRITMSYRTPEGTGTTEFEVERIGTRLGLFPEWGFAISPVAVLALDVQHDTRFTVNGVDGDTGRDAAGPASFAVFVPGAYVLGHDTTFLRAADVAVLADEVGGTVDATVDVQPEPEFATTLAAEVEEHLDACADQQVLFPTGCPFGEAISNRIVTAPEWSIEIYPELGIEPGTFRTWIAGPAPGTAHLVVDVQSLFDGSVDTFDQDVPFQARYSITISGDTLLVTEQPLEEPAAG